MRVKKKGAFIMGKEVLSGIPKVKFEESRMLDKLTTDTHGLMIMLNAGRKTSTEIGVAAGAKIMFGNKILWNIKKIQVYLDSISE